MKIFRKMRWATDTFFIASLIVVFCAIDAKNILIASLRISSGRSVSMSVKVAIRRTENIFNVIQKKPFYCFGFLTHFNAESCDGQKGMVKNSHFTCLPIFFFGCLCMKYAFNKL